MKSDTVVKNLQLCHSLVIYNHRIKKTPIKFQKYLNLTLFGSEYGQLGQRNAVWNLAFT
jgi:hypothetical protein